MVHRPSDGVDIWTRSWSNTLLKQDVNMSEVWRSLQAHSIYLLPSHFLRFKETNLWLLFRIKHIQYFVYFFIPRFILFSFI